MSPSRASPARDRRLPSRSRERHRGMRARSAIQWHLPGARQKHEPRLVLPRARLGAIARDDPYPSAVFLSPSTARVTLEELASLSLGCGCSLSVPAVENHLGERPHRAPATGDPPGPPDAL